MWVMMRHWGGNYDRVRGEINGSLSLTFLQQIVTAFLTRPPKTYTQQCYTLYNSHERMLHCLPCLHTTLKANVTRLVPFKHVTWLLNQIPTLQTSFHTNSNTCTFEHSNTQRLLTTCIIIFVIRIIMNIIIIVMPIILLYVHILTLYNICFYLLTLLWVTPSLPHTLLSTPKTFLASPGGRELRPPAKSNERGQNKIEKCIKM